MRNENLLIDFSVTKSIRGVTGKKDFQDTRDRVSLVFSPDLLTFTLFNQLPEAMKDRIVRDILDKKYELENFAETAKTLIERIIKYEALEESLKS